MKLELLIENKLGSKIPSKKEIEGGILEVLRNKKIDVGAEIGLKIVGKAEIRKLNQKFRQINEPTDVLSFPIYDKVPKKTDKMILLGDIVICFDIMIENAKKYGHSAEEEFRRLIEHSVLHLLGYHHK